MDDQAREDLEALESILTDITAEPTELSYASIISITRCFSEPIGTGGFGEVFLGRLRNGLVAVKRLRTASPLLCDDQFLNEVQCLKKVKHKNIVRFLGYCACTNKAQIMENEGKHVLVETVRQRLLCFEYVPNGNLHNYLEGNYNASDWNRRYQIIKGICLGLQYLHKQRITHLDLKPENVLLDSHMEPQITDFGLSRCFDGSQSRVVTRNIRGTMGYVAPEFWFAGEISLKADIYSLGVVIEKILRPYQKSTDNCEKSSDVEGARIVKCIEIAQICVCTDQHNRPTIDTIIDELNQIDANIEMVPAVIEQSTNGPGYVTMTEKLSPFTHESRKRLGPSEYQAAPSASRELLHIHPSNLGCPFAPNKTLPFSLQLTNNSKDDCVAFMFLGGSDRAVFSTLCRRGVIRPQSTWGIVLHLELKAGEEQVVQDKQRQDVVLVRTTIVSQGFNADAITIDWFNEQAGVHDIDLDVVFVEPSQPRPPPPLLRQFDQLQMGAREETGHATTKACPGSINTELLDIYPLEFRLPLEKLANRAIHLTNTTDNDICFWIVPSARARYSGVSDSFLSGVVSTQSTCAVSLVLLDEESEPPNPESFDILMLTSSSLDMSYLNLHLTCSPVDLAEYVLKAAKQNGGLAHQARLFVSHSDLDPVSCIDEPSISTNSFGKIISMDVHPAEPLVLTGHHKHVCLWRSVQRHNRIPEQARGFIDATDFVVKFIARSKLSKWALSGDSSGRINVYTIRLELLRIVTAHSGPVRSLAVHPSHPYLLSSSDDHLIKLWDWDNAWTCTREFVGHLDSVTQVAFNPKETNTFASVSSLSSDCPGNVKIWSIDSTDPMTDLYGEFKTIDWSTTVNDRQCMVALVDNGVVEIWDMQTETCIHAIKDYMRNDINVVVCHPTLPLLFTGTMFSAFRIWNLTTHRMEYTCAFQLGEVIGFGFRDIAGCKRLMLGYEKIVKPLDIDLPTLAGEH